MFFLPFKVFTSYRHAFDTTLIMILLMEVLVFGDQTDSLMLVCGNLSNSKELDFWSFLER